MDAIIIHAPNELSVESLPLPELKPTSIRVRTKFTSISAGTERMTIEGRLPGMPQLQFPLIPGYENVGVITEVGDEVTELKVGDRVFLPGTVGYDGYFPVFGGQVSESVSDWHRAVKIPDGLSDEVALLIALGATAHHGVATVIKGRGAALGEKPLSDLNVLVLGQGIVGQLAVRMLTHYGARTTVADVQPFRVGLSEADHFITITGDPVQSIPANEFDVVFEASGSEEAFDAAVHGLKKHGLLLVLGFYEKLSVTFGPAFIKEINLKIAGEWNAEDVAFTTGFLKDNDSDLGQLITHQLSASNPKRVYDVALNDPECLKIALTWK